MHFFASAPPRYRKILAVYRSMRGEKSLAAHYVERFDHLVPKDVEIWEIGPEAKTGRCVFRGDQAALVLTA